MTEKHPCGVAIPQPPKAPKTAYEILNPTRGVTVPLAPSLPATMFHDAGAIAQCFYCRRYTLDPKALSDRQPTCECGKKEGWSGSFKPPGPDAKWSGKAPAGVPGTPNDQQERPNG